MAHDRYLLICSATKRLWREDSPFAMPAHQWMEFGLAFFAHRYRAPRKGGSDWSDQWRTTCVRMVSAHHALLWMLIIQDTFFPQQPRRG